MFWKIIFGGKTGNLLKHESIYIYIYIYFFFFLVRITALEKGFGKYDFLVKNWETIFLKKYWQSFCWISALINVMCP